MSNIATKSVRCPRCQAIINRGDKIEVYYKTSGGLRKWAHLGCSSGNPPVQSQSVNQTAPVGSEPHAIDGSVDETKRLAEIVKGEMARIHREVLEDVGGRHAKSVDSMRSWVGEMAGLLSEKIANEIEDAKGKVMKVVHVVQNDDVQTEFGDEIFHNAIWRVLKLAKAKLNILLVGPTGSGKSHLCEQLAKLLNLDRFGMISCSGGLTESKLLGRAVPNIHDGTSCYQGTDFLDVYENGGVFLIDEMDALDPNMALVINSALANNRLAVPDRASKPYADKHPNAVIIAAANTWGTGASRSYVGRNQLDEATLDRFRYGTVEMDYDEELERRLCPDAELASLLHQWRAKIREARLCRILSSRFMRDAYRMKQVGDTTEDLKSAFFSGWTEDERRKVLGS